MNINFYYVCPSNLTYCYNVSVYFDIMFVFIMLTKSFHTSHIIDLEVTSPVVGSCRESRNSTNIGLWPVPQLQYSKKSWQ